MDVPHYIVMVRMYSKFQVYEVQVLKIKCSQCDDLARFGVYLTKLARFRVYLTPGGIRCIFFPTLPTLTTLTTPPTLPIPLLCTTTNF